MPTFTYRAVDARGGKTRGRITAASEAALTRDLEARGLMALQVTESRPAREIRFDPRGGRRKAVLDFTWGMAALLPAGMPIGRALAVATGTSPESIRPALSRVRERVERGEDIARALAGEPGIFDPLYIGIVQAGETGGALGSAFERLASHLEREDRLRGKLVSMSIYPAALALVGLASVLLLVLFVLPRFADLLTGTGAPLPTMTAAVLGIATAAREGWVFILGAIAAFVGLLVWMWTTPAGRAARARALVAAPIVGRPRREVLAARFARMVGELTAGGAPLLAGLRVTRDCIDDPLARDVVDRIWTRVREGSSLNHAIAQHPLFPSELVQLVSLGEEAGRLSEFLLKSADLLERRTERSLERLVALVEPAMIIGFGGMIAVVALSLLQAIYGVNVGAL